MNFDQQEVKSNDNDWGSDFNGFASIFSNVSHDAFRAEDFILYIQNVLGAFSDFLERLWTIARVTNEKVGSIDIL